MFRIAVAVCLCFAAVAGASAQNDRSVGLTIGYPSAAGVIWQVADRVAIRTDASLSSSWSDSDPVDAGDGIFRVVGSSMSTSGHTFGVGVSVLIKVAQWERLRAYVAPRAAYSRSSTTSEFNWSVAIPLPGGIRPSPATFKTRSSTQTYGASFGTQYGLGDRFAAFGEVGVAYASSRSPDTTTLAFGSGGSISPLLDSLGVTSSFSVSSPRPRTNSIGIRSGVGVIFFF